MAAQNIIFYSTSIQSANSTDFNQAVKKKFCKHAQHNERMIFEVLIKQTYNKIYIIHEGSFKS